MFVNILSIVVFLFQLHCLKFTLCLWVCLFVCLFYFILFYFLFFIIFSYNPCQLILFLKNKNITNSLWFCFVCIAYFKLFSFCYFMWFVCGYSVFKNGIVTANLYFILFHFKINWKLLLSTCVVLCGCVRVACSCLELYLKNSFYNLFKLF